MNLKTFKRRIIKLQSNDSELIDKYNNILDDCIDDHINEMYMLYTKLIESQPSADPIEFIQSSLKISIASNIPIIEVMETTINKLVFAGDEKTSLQQYFRDISNIYNKNDNNYKIEYCENNRDKLIEMNLKTVISVAKGYQGLGLSLEELISAGNMGLIIAFDKYDPKRATLKDNMIDSIKDLDNNVNEDVIINSIQQYLVYGDIMKKFIKSFQINGQWKQFTKEDIIRWIKRNVKNATFNSVAFMWIRAYILIEIDNYSRLVKKPKSEIYNDKIKFGSYKKELTYDIDAPINNDTDTSLSEILYEIDDSIDELDVSEAYDIYKSGLNKLLDGVKSRDRTVFLKKFGIGLPRPMSPREIADQENLSIARISQIFQNVIDQIMKNQVKYNINVDSLFEAARKFR